VPRRSSAQSWRLHVHTQMYIFVSNPSIRSAQNPRGGDDVVLASVHEEEDVVAGLRGPRARLGADGAGLLMV